MNIDGIDNIEACEKFIDENNYSFKTCISFLHSNNNPQFWKCCELLANNGNFEAQKYMHNYYDYMYYDNNDNDKQNLEQAFKYAKMAVDQDSTDSQLLVTLACSYSDMNNKEKYIEYLQKAADLNDINAHEILADICENAENYKEALYHYKSIYNLSKKLYRMCAVIQLYYKYWDQLKNYIEKEDTEIICGVANKFAKDFNYNFRYINCNRDLQIFHIMIYCYKLAAEKGSMEAHYYLSLCYSDAYSYQNFDKAFKYLKTVILSNDTLWKEKAEEQLRTLIYLIIHDADYRCNANDSIYKFILELLSYF